MLLLRRLQVASQINDLVVHPKERIVDFSSGLFEPWMYEMLLSDGWFLVFRVLEEDDIRRLLIRESVFPRKGVVVDITIAPSLHLL